MIPTFTIRVFQNVLHALLEWKLILQQTLAIARMDKSIQITLAVAQNKLLIREKMDAFLVFLPITLINLR